MIPSDSRENQASSLTLFPIRVYHWEPSSPVAAFRSPCHTPEQWSLHTVLSGDKLRAFLTSLLKLSAAG